MFRPSSIMTRSQAKHEERTDYNSLLAVGGVGTTPPEHWTNSKGQLWLGTLDAKSAPDIGILSFPNKLAANGVLSGRDVEDEGAALLGELSRLVEDETVRLPLRN